MIVIIIHSTKQAGIVTRLYTKLEDKKLYAVKKHGFKF